MPLLGPLRLSPTSIDERLGQRRPDQRHASNALLRGYHMQVNEQRTASAGNLEQRHRPQRLVAESIDEAAVSER